MRDWIETARRSPLAWTALALGPLLLWDLAGGDLPLAMLEIGRAHV